MEKVFVDLSFGGVMPEKAYASDSGYDLRSTTFATLKPMERLGIPTGVKIALPMGYEALIRPRSGLALKHGITVLNTPGTIDTNYRGEIIVILINLGNESFTIEKNMKIAQMIINKKSTNILLEKIEGGLDATDRNTDGFNSTGTF